MLDEIEEFLSGVLTPEMTHVYVEALRVILESGISLHIFQMEEIIQNEENIGRDQVIVEIDLYLKNVLESTLNQFGVFLNEDFSVKVGTAIIRSINTLDNFDDVETIEALCLSEESPEERLAALVELTSELQAEDILLNVESVSPALLKRLLETVHKVDDGLSTLPPQRTNAIVRIKSCVQQLKTPWLLEYVDQGGSINRPIQDMAQAFRTFYEEKLEKNALLERDFEQVALQLVSFVLAADLKDEQLLRASEDIIEETFIKIPLILKYTEQVRSILAAIPNEKD